MLHFDSCDHYHDHETIRINLITLLNKNYQEENINNFINNESSIFDKIQLYVPKSKFYSTLLFNDILYDISLLITTF